MFSINLKMSVLRVHGKLFLIFFCSYFFSTTRRSMDFIIGCVLHLLDIKWKVVGGNFGFYITGIISRTDGQT